LPAAEPPVLLRSTPPELVDAKPGVDPCEPIEYAPPRMSGTPPQLRPFRQERGALPRRQHRLRR
jgi:hypothetical protein